MMAYISCTKFLVFSYINTRVIFICVIKHEVVCFAKTDFGIEADLPQVEALLLILGSGLYDLVCDLRSDD